MQPMTLRLTFLMLVISSFFAGEGQSATVSTPLHPPLLAFAQIVRPRPSFVATYSVVIEAPKHLHNDLASCSLEYKGIVLARPSASGTQTFKFGGTFRLNTGIDAIQLACQLKGYENLQETLQLKGDRFDIQTQFQSLKLVQDASVDPFKGAASIRLKIPAFKRETITVDGKDFVKLSSESPDIFSSSYSGLPGLPEFPQTSVVIALPLDASIDQLEVIPGKFSEPLPMLLVPLAEAGQPESLNDTIRVFDPSVYFKTKDRIDIVKDTRFEFFRDSKQHLLKITSPLVELLPGSSALRLIEELNFSIRFKSSSPCFRPPYRGRDPVDLYRATQLLGLQQFALNSADILSGCRASGTIGFLSQPLAPQSLSLRTELSRDTSRLASIARPTIGPNLLIVSPRDFLEQAQLFKDHKENLGIRTAVLEWNGTDPAQLKSTIKTLYDSFSPNYLQWILLLGDVKHIPMPYDRNLGDPNYGDFAISGGDIFYGQIPSDPALDSSFLDPTIAIGRIPAKNPEQLATVLARLINFERSPPKSEAYYQSPTLTATLQVEGDATFGSRNNYAENMETTLAKPMLQKGFRPERIYRTDTPEALAPKFWSPAASDQQASKLIDYPSLTRVFPDQTPAQLFHIAGSESLIDSSLQRGTSLLFNRGHASIHEWGNPSFSYDAERFSLFPADRPPLVISLSCLTGFYDAETIQDPGNLTGEQSDFHRIDPHASYMAEQLLLGTNGALGVIAGNRMSFWTFNNLLLKGFARALIDQKENNNAIRQDLGNILNFAKISAKLKVLATGQPSSSVSSSIRHHFLTYNLLGDPSLVLKLSPPLSFKSSAPPIYDQTSKRLTLRFRIEANTCPACDLSLQKEPEIAVLRDDKKNIVSRALVHPITDPKGFNREVVLENVSTYYGSLYQLVLSGAGLTLRETVIDNRIQ